MNGWYTVTKWYFCMVVCDGVVHLLVGLPHKCMLVYFLYGSFLSIILSGGQSTIILSMLATVSIQVLVRSSFSLLCNTRTLPSGHGGVTTRQFPFNPNHSFNLHRGDLALNHVCESSMRYKYSSGSHFVFLTMFINIWIQLFETWMLHSFIHSFIHPHPHPYSMVIYKIYSNYHIYSDVKVNLILNWSYYILIYWFLLLNFCSVIDLYLSYWWSRIALR